MSRFVPPDFHSPAWLDEAMTTFADAPTVLRARARGTGIASRFAVWRGRAVELAAAEGPYQCPAGTLQGGHFTDASGSNCDEPSEARPGHHQQEAHPSVPVASGHALAGNRAPERAAPPRLGVVSEAGIAALTANNKAGEALRAQAFSGQTPESRATAATYLAGLNEVLTHNADHVLWERHWEVSTRGGPTFVSHYQLDDGSAFRVSTTARGAITIDKANGPLDYQADGRWHTGGVKMGELAESSAARSAAAGLLDSGRLDNREGQDRQRARVEAKLEEASVLETLASPESLGPGGHWAQVLADRQAAGTWKDASEEAVARARSEVQRLWSEGHVAVRVDHKGLDSLLGTGRTGRPAPLVTFLDRVRVAAGQLRGALGASLPFRAAAEQRAFNIPEKSRDRGLRPLSGYLEHPELDPHLASLQNYGSVVVHLKDAVKEDRSLLAGGDVVTDRVLPYTGTGIRGGEFDPRLLMGTPVPGTRPPLDPSSREMAFENRAEDGDKRYMEVGVLGRGADPKEHGVTAADVDHITIEPRTVFWGPADQQQDQRNKDRQTVDRATAALRRVGYVERDGKWKTAEQWRTG